MKILQKLFLAGMVATMMSSCTVFTSYTATGNPVGTKVGVAKSSIFGNSDASVKTAAEDGNITKIGSVDVTVKVFIFPFTKTIVTGE